MKELIKILQIRIDRSKSFIIGIDGLGGAGKTTFSESLYKILQQHKYTVQTLHLDDFIHKISIRYNPKIDDVECYYNVQWRYNYLVKNVLEPFKLHNRIEGIIEIYDKDNDKYNHKHINLSKDPVLLIEGIFLQRVELKKYFDFVIYMDTPKDIRFQRVLDRDKYIGDIEQIISKYKNRYFPAEEKYESQYSPRENADFLI